MRNLGFGIQAVRALTVMLATAVALGGCPSAPDLPVTDGSSMDAAMDGPLGDVRTDTPRMDVPTGDTTGTDAPDTGADAGPPECAIDTDCPTADMCETATCAAGRCVRALVDCSDGDDCTDDVCDGLTGTCSNPGSADGTACATGACCSGTCIDVGSDPGNCGTCGTVCGANATCGTGACVCTGGFLDCDAMPGCEVSSVDPLNCGACGMACTAPTPSCLSGGCGSCTTGADCADDGLSCTGTPTCAAGVCSYPVVGGSCLVGGGCYASGALSPTNTCLACVPSTSTTAFTPLTGAVCDDGTFCTDADVCDGGGACTGVVRSCDDGLLCTMDTCNESLARCDNRAGAAQCAIDGACWRSGDANPLNPTCQVCTPGTEAYAWSALAGAACDDGAFCTVADSCDSAGACGGLPRACADTFSCTLDLCDEASSACVNPVDPTSCQIGGVCYLAGETNPANVCQICDPARGPAVWSANDGATCDDLAFCTVSDTCDSSAACVGTPRVCDDALSCTNDACNETMDRCDVLPQVDFCAIGGTCYPNGTPDPLNGCQACIAAQSGTAWSPRTAQSCDDSAYCTDPDTCSSSAVCGGPARDCNDGLACTTDSCNAGARTCDHVLMAGNCVIGGACYAAGTANPANACQACVPGTSTSAWTARTGTVCDDGQFCTTGDACSAAGTCVGSTRSCADTLGCTSDSCDEAADACVNALQADFCSISGACYANGIQNPTNTCEACTAATSTTAWSPRTGVICDDGLFCTPTDTCNSSGVCTGPARDCSDPDTCTLDTCNETTNVCDHSLTGGFCTIGGTCYAATALNPANDCEACNPATSTSAWTVRTGLSCNDNLYCTTGDVCSSAATCAGVARSCADSLACTSDTCNEGADRCDNPLLGGNCLIAGSCYTNGTVDSMNACQSCQSGASTVAWSPRTGTACNDGQFCTVGDACTAAANCVGSPNLCSDSLACTTDTCDETSNACSSAVSSGCVIGGACYAAGATNAGNVCQICDPARSTLAWSANTGTACNDGLFCTIGDVCTAAATCSGAARSCADPLSCTVDSCDEAGDACMNTLQADFCAIAGSCYPNGTIDPANFCAVCNAPTSTTAWSPRTGVACTDGLFCTSSDACTASATCTGAPTDCDDTLSCTADSCNEGANVCVNTLLALNCLIGGTCYANNALSPTNQCEWCRSASSTTLWSPRVGAVCDDGLYCTDPDRCNASASCVGSARNCDDSFLCTSDFCDEGASTCTHPLLSGFCFISGACYASPTINPANACQICASGSSTSSWTPRIGTRCDDGSVAGCGMCQASGSCATDTTCMDSLSCTIDTCNDTNAACTAPVAAGSCSIGAACYTNGTPNPANLCQICDSTSSQTTWSPNTGTRCNDGVPDGCGVCNSSSVCSTATTCTDGLGCTTDTCNDASGVCSQALIAGWCSIAMSCYANTMVNVANACQVCDTTANPSAWTARTGTRCDDGSVAGCGTCTAAAACTASTTCTDGASCTTDTCTDLTGVCSYPPTVGMCAIGGACYAQGTVNAANSCQHCDTAASQTAWTARTGTRCNDGNPAGCGVCNSSAVCATSTTCNDSFSCTTDTCDDPSGTCSAAVATGCLIASSCYAEGTVNPANPCQICTAASSTTAWTARTGTTCDDLDADGCGVCSAAGLCATASTCSDGLACTTDTCTDATGVCVTSVSVGNCAISGACYANGVHDASNPCQFCSAAASQTAWTADTGARCDDGLAVSCGTCTGAATCASTTCADSLSCTTDTCADATGVCTNAVAAGNCVIAGVCRANGFVNPANSCQSCSTAMSTTAWTPRTGVACDDGLFCVASEACTSMATCVGTPLNCTDGVDCTADTCNETTNACEFSLAGGSCTIAGTCYPAMGVNMANQCQWCDPATSTTAWTTRTGLGCNDGSVAGCGLCSAAAACVTMTTCNDSIACTTDTCNDATSACSAPIAAGQCLVAGSCYANGTVNAGTCELCNSAVSQTMFTPAAGSTTCRAAVSACDIAEVCTGASTACPANLFASASTVCRGAAGTCDAIEYCTGASSTCPAEAYLLSGECRASQGDCDPAESCNGSGAACPPDLLNGPLGGQTPKVCRAEGASGVCDVAESCNGSSTNCPTDLWYAGGSTHACRTAVNDCDVTEYCGGSSFSCPADGFAPATAACGALADGNLLTCQSCSGSAATCTTRTTCVDDGQSCTTDACVCGSGGANCSTGNTCSTPVTSGCLISMACVLEGAINPANECQACVSATSTTAWTARPVGTRCDDGTVAGCGTCNATPACATNTTCSDGESCSIDTCTDLTAVCTYTLRGAGAQCRASAGFCDPAESCTGASVSCPADLFSPATTVCTASTGICDPTEYCTGSTAACPPNLLYGPMGGQTPFVCRAATNVCDVAESCNGSVATCPTDAFAANTTACGALSDADPLTCQSCTGTAATCTTRTTCIADGYSCTTDACTCGASCLSGNTCSTPISTGCLIASACWTSGVVNPSNECQACTPGTSTTAWTARPVGTACNDGSVAGCGQCNAAPACATVSTCSDGNVCSTDTCTDSTGACTYPAGGTGTTCRAAVNECDVVETCTGSSTTCPTDAFAASTTSCTTLADALASTCQSCTGTAATCTTRTTCVIAGSGCAANACTCGANCNSGNTCTYPGTGCLIAGACWASGAVNPADACGICTPGTSTTAWSPRVVGTTCRAAVNACDVAETCTGASVTCPADAFASNTTACGALADANAATCQSCSGTAATCALRTSCSDGVSCTTDTCTCGANCNSGNTCSYPAAAGNCYISGACYTAGTINAANPCQVCNSGASAWASRANGVACGGAGPSYTCGDHMCCSGACVTRSGVNCATCGSSSCTGSCTPCPIGPCARVCEPPADACDVTGYACVCTML